MDNDNDRSKLMMMSQVIIRSHHKPWAMGGDLAPSLEGRKNFWITFFKEKFPFLSRKFLMTFLVMSFACLYSLKSDLYITIWSIYNIYVPFLHEDLYFTEKIRSSQLFSNFITLLLQILGGRMHEPSPTSNLFWVGAVPPVPPKSPPLPWAAG